MSHERPPEPASPATRNLVVYPSWSLYAAALVVDPAFRRRGFGSALLREWLARGTGVYTHPDARGSAVAHSLQTGAADSNMYVVYLYKSFGFEIAGYKDYPDRSDYVMWRHDHVGK